MQPENYWIERGHDVIGREVWCEATGTRQALTYSTIADEIIARGYKTVLDIGCNVGVIARFLQLQGYTGDYVGVDTNYYALEEALSHGLKVKLADLRVLGSLPCDNDCVVVKDVIEHLESMAPLRGAFLVAQKAVVLGLFIPLWDGPTKVQKMEAGYFHNQYNRQEVLALAEDLDFRLDLTVPTPEATGEPNEVHVFVRNPKPETHG